MDINQQRMLAQGILNSGNTLQRPIDPYGASTVNPYTPQASGFTPQAPTPAVDPRYANALRTYGAEEEAIKAQRLKAAALAKDANEAPGLITAGKVSAPGANWMTALSQAGNAWAGMKEGEKARALSKTLAKDQAKSEKDAGELAAEALAEELRRDERDAALAAAKEEFNQKNVNADNARADRAEKRQQQLANLELELKQRDLGSITTIDTTEMINPKTGETFEAISTETGMVRRDPESGELVPVDERSNRRITSDDSERLAGGGLGVPLAEEDTIGQRRYKKAQELESSTERTRANLYIGVAEQLQNIMKQGNDIVSSGNSPSRFKSFGSSAARMLTPTSLEDAASNAANEMMYDDDQMNFISNLDNAVGDLRKARTGANVTSIETILGENWDPTVKGITFPEKLRRAEQLQKNLVNTSLRGYGIEEFDVIPAWKEGLSLIPDQAKAADEVITVTSMEEAMSLPAGTSFIDPNGVSRVR